MFARLWGGSSKKPLSPSSTKPVDATLTGRLQHVQLRTPSPSTEAPTESVPPRSPHRALAESESLMNNNAVTRDALLKQLRGIPPQTLHDYFMDHLPEATPSELINLESFTARLTPPPRLHCARCHATYTDIENNETSCRVAHDDDAADVQRAGTAQVKGVHSYETYWACCDRTVAGDGDLGPPDGWCYEGKHTTDRKRARFRYDSSMTDDKLQSCEERRCGQSHKRKRSRRKAGGDDSDAESIGAVSVRSTRTAKTSKTVATAVTSNSNPTKPRSRKKIKSEKPDPAPAPVVEDGVAEKTTAKAPRKRTKTVKLLEMEEGMDVDDADDAKSTVTAKPRKKRKSAPS